MTDADGKANPAAQHAGVAADGRLFVFAYGSLIWKPGFTYLSARPATIHGYHRDFCIHSVVHRGTPQRSGLVLGLAPGGACKGMVFEVAAAQADRVIAALDARELVTSVYKVAALPVWLGDLRIRARAYVSDTAHPQYAGRLSIAQMAERICGAVGNQGPNEDYLVNSVSALREIGLRDQRLEALYREVVRRSDNLVAS